MSHKRGILRKVEKGHWLFIKRAFSRKARVSGAFFVPMSHIGKHIFARCVCAKLKMQLRERKYTVFNPK